MMHILKEKLTEKSYRFDFETSPPFQNDTLQSIVIAIRRVMLSEVPSVAMDGYSVYRNDSILPNEILASRIELVPMTAGNVISQISDYPTCECHIGGQVNRDGCEKCTIRRRLYIHNDTPDVMPVYTSSIKPVLPNEPNDFHPVHPGILLVSINSGSCIDFELCYRKGMSEYHAKWSVAQVAYNIVEKGLKYSLTVSGNGAIPPPMIMTLALSVLRDKFLYIQRQLLDLLACDQ